MEKRKDGEDEYGAFIHKFKLDPLPSAHNQQLPLHGLTFAIKDIFDVSGYVTGFGNPEWAQTHAAATSTSPAVMLLLQAGATCLGKTIMDEFALSVNGENKHYRTPKNPCAPGRVPGGSSSGSAVAVAAKLVDFSLGTDTGGSVRVPAAYCGILGYRPSHGAVSTSKVIPFAQSFDTVGWFARNPTILAKVGRVLLQSPFDATIQPTNIIIAEDCFEHLTSPQHDAYQILISSVKKIFSSDVIKQQNLGDYIVRNVPSLKSFTNGEASENVIYTIDVLAILYNANRNLQRTEFKANHYEWLHNVKAEFSPLISERLSEIFADKCENVESYNNLRVEFRAAIDALLQEYTVLAIPTVTGQPPELETKTQKLENFRASAFPLLCLAGLSGVSQITIPFGMHEDLPVSISLLAGKGKDHFLLNFAQTLYEDLKEQAEFAWELKA